MWARLGLSEDIIDALTGTIWGWSMDGVTESRRAAPGVDPTDPRLNQAWNWCASCSDFPRHLSQHVGGLVISRGALDDLVPIENAAMDDRTVIEWDKDDLDALGILKVDVLALGMLSCLRRGIRPGQRITA